MNPQADLYCSPQTLGIDMKINLVFFRFYSLALLASFSVSAALFTSAADYTIKCGFVVHKEYILPASISVCITAIMLYIYKKLVKKIESD